MLNQKKWIVLIAALFLGLAVELFAPDESLKTAAAATKAEMTTLVDAGEQLSLVCTEDIWKEALDRAEKRDLALMSSSTDHIVNYHGERFAITEDDYQVLIRIVEAEAGGEDITGKMLVANVIMNRVQSGRFPDTVTEVVYQKNANGKAQFSPTVNGRIDSVRVSQETVDAVERVLGGEDSSNGALYFRSVRSNGTWHDNALRRVVEHGNHIFYTI